jgi:hypothetical protein
VLKVLTVGRLITYIVLDGIFSQPPEMHEAGYLSPLYQKRFNNYQEKPAVCSTRLDWEINLLEFRVVGNTPVSQDELALISNFTPFSTFMNASFTAEGEWRWRNDQEAFELEASLAAAADQAKKDSKKQRYETRLKHLTWDVLLTENMFARWSPSPPFPPLGFVDAVSAEFRRAIVELRNISDKPTKKDTRRILRALVHRINSLDDAYGNVVETEEREDLCAALEEIAFVARHRNLIEEVDAWRAW